VERALSIVVVEDEPLTRRTVATFLERQGHEVRQASCVASFRAALRSGPPADVVLVDIGLPGEDGLALARELHQSDQCGVIIVSQQGELATRVAALQDGADDYLVKPVHLDELAARVRSVARRRAPSSRGTLTAGSLVLDPATRQVQLGGRQVAVTRGEFNLLRKLVEANGKIVSRELLSEAVARGDGDGDLRSVDALVSRLRRKLQTPDSPTVIATAPGFGYRLALAPAGV